MRTARLRRRSPWFGITAVAVVALAAACAGSGDADEPFRPIAIGEPVPELTVRTLAGDTARIEPGQPVTLLNVWATWCGPCEKEFPEIEALQREYGPRGLRIVAVSVDEGDDAPVREFVSAKGATFEIGRDPEGAVRRLYQGIGVPESYLISTDGTLLVRQFGAIPDGGTSLRAAIEKALAAVEMELTSREVRRAAT